MNSPLSLLLPALCLANFASVPIAKLMDTFKVSVGIGYVLHASSYIIAIHFALPPTWNLDKYPALPKNQEGGVMLQLEGGFLFFS
ncbi:uncharacterized protein FIBRA_09481 [Fibroporia radiculosa]|uniref:Uncharacterized protein n=1 Tax=Fibroporia radiculosa TaxID=599839 RepID=J7S6J0_9APHY|nr:uncharacterized protein FIBRA_09481 [Fibroporia radiculosa]CCM07144.1 predicted protein [Fibroporia radiculosa]